VCLCVCLSGCVWLSGCVYLFVLSCQSVSVCVCELCVLFGRLSVWTVFRCV